MAKKKRTYYTPPKSKKETAARVVGAAAVIGLSAHQNRDWMHPAVFAGTQTALVGAGAYAARRHYYRAQDKNPRTPAKAATHAKRKPRVKM